MQRSRKLPLKRFREKNKQQNQQKQNFHGKNSISKFECSKWQHQNAIG